MNINYKNLTLQILALLGLILSIKLVLIYNSANYDQYALSSFCSINDFIDCDGVAKTTFSQFLGIPLAYWGVFFYTIILFLTVVNHLKNIKLLGFLNVFKNPQSYISTLGTIAFTCSIVLASISLFFIKKLCILCFATYFIDLIIAIVASDCNFKTLLASFKTTFFDFIEGAKRFPKTFIILLILTISFVTYSGTTYNFVPNVKVKKSLMKYQKMKYNPYRTKGNVLGNPNGDVVIELYSDFVCPICYVNNIILHKTVKEYKNVKVIHHNYPFDKECNPYVTINMHPHACYMSKAALAAKKQGNYWEMSSLIYENQPKKAEDVLKLAEQLNFDIAKFNADMNSEDIAKELENDIKNAANIEIDATPTMFINGEEIKGVKPIYVLEEILRKHGAHR